MATKLGNKTAVSSTPPFLPERRHPRDHGYQIWAKSMEPKLVELLGE